MQDQWASSGLSADTEPESTLIAEPGAPLQLVLIKRGGGEASSSVLHWRTTGLGIRIVPDHSGGGSPQASYQHS